MQATLRDPGRIRGKVMNQNGSGKGRKMLVALLLCGAVIGALWGTLRTEKKSSSGGSTKVAAKNSLEVDLTPKGKALEKRLQRAEVKGQEEVEKETGAKPEQDVNRDALLTMDEKVKEISSPSPPSLPVWDCQTTQGDIVIRLRPDWAPHGAKRMGELLEMGFFTNMTFFRVPPLQSNPIAQFGAISVDSVRVKVSHLGHIPDDTFPVGHQERSEPPHQLKGHFGFGGSGPDSRTWHMWVARADFAKINPALGRNVWDSSVAEIIEGVSVVDKISVVGDMKPWGDGPDTGKMYADHTFGDPKEFPGRYLKEKFPTIDWFRSCEKRGG